MVTYNSASIYLSSKKNAREKIIAIDNIIDALLTTTLTAVTPSSEGTIPAMFTEYDLDTGQTKIKCMYRSPQEIMQSITTMQAIKEHYVNIINGRSMHLVDGKNFRPPYYGSGLV